MRFALRLALTGLFVLLASRPAAGQIGFEDVDWGIDPQATIAKMAEAGLTLDAESTTPEGDLVFTNGEPFTITAMFSEGRLVSFMTLLPLPNGGGEDVFAGLRADFLGRYGEPATDEPYYVEWVDGETGLAIALAEDESGRYISLLHMGPGYEYEDRRRALASGTLYPELEPRWTVVVNDIGSRSAFDRTTVAAQGGGVHRTWVRTDYVDLVDNPAQHDQSVVQVDIDCGQRRLRLVNGVYRLQDDVVQRYAPVEPDPWVPAEPESLGEAMLTAVCTTSRR
jgi:hypothetical protein